MNYLDRGCLEFMEFLFCEIYPTSEERNAAVNHWSFNDHNIYDDLEMRMDSYEILFSDWFLYEYDIDDNIDIDDYLRAVQYIQKNKTDNIDFEKLSKEYILTEYFEIYFLWNVERIIPKLKKKYNSIN